MMASRSHVNGLVTRRLLSPAIRRYRPSQPKNRSTTQGLNNTANPCCPSGIGTIARPEASAVLLPQAPRPTGPAPGGAFGTVCPRHPFI